MPEEELRTLIRDAGYRATKQRVAFLRVVINSHTPQGVAEIAAAMGKDADVVTAYRIAESFEKAGLLTRVELRSGKAHYEFAHRTHHHHIVCTDCGTVEDVDVCLPEQVTRTVTSESQQFTKITAHALEFFGTCKSCTYA